MNNDTAIRTCTACKNEIKVGRSTVTLYNADGYCLKLIGVEKLPWRGFHMETNRDGKKKRMWPVCKKCFDKIERAKKKAEKSKK